MSFRFFADDDMPELIPPKADAPEKAHAPDTAAPDAPRQAPE